MNTARSGIDQGTLRPLAWFATRASDRATVPPNAIRSAWIAATTRSGRAKFWYASCPQEVPLAWRSLQHMHSAILETNPGTRRRGPERCSRRALRRPTRGRRPERRCAERCRSIVRPRAPPHRYAGRREVGCRAGAPHFRDACRRTMSRRACTRAHPPADEQHAA